MSKSLGNYIAITDSPDEMYGKTLSIPDDLLYDYFLLTTDIPGTELSVIKEQIESKSVNPRDLKRRLAREIVSLYHDAGAAAQAEENFDRIFVRKENPDDVEEYTSEAIFGPHRSAAGRDDEIQLFDLLVKIRAAKSNSEARRLVSQGGVTRDGVKLNDPNLVIKLATEPFILKVGKRKFYKVRK